MKLDSEEQRKALLDLLSQVPVNTNLQGLLAGAAPEIVTLMQTIQHCPLEDGTPSALLGQGVELTSEQKKELAAQKRKATMARKKAEREAAGDRPKKKTPRRSGQKKTPRGG